jgi:hypothetical protein
MQTYILKISIFGARCCRLLNSILKLDIMRYVKLISFLSIIVLITGCGSYRKMLNNTFTGEYRAEVKCYNYDSGAISTYKLNIEAKENVLMKISWNSYGCKDDSHFNPPTINKSGYCEFTSDKGNKYEVQITGHVRFSKRFFQSDDDMEEEKLDSYYDEDDLYWDEYPFIE